MYTATMEYPFNKGDGEKLSQIWKDRVLAIAEKQPGFVRMMWLLKDDCAMAIGIWEKESHAHAFMETGIFKELMGEIESLLSKTPTPRIWDLKFYAQK